MKEQSRTGQLRIIGGRWRSRKLEFPAQQDLRPTPDRIRETLFNWLRDVIYGARCLDLFAGSGALGFEAFSRGAASVVMVDSDPIVIQHLRTNAATLGAKELRIIHASSAGFIRNPATVPFDIVFLDPPFRHNLLAECCEDLESNDWLTHNAFIYIEMPAQQALPDVPPNWGFIRSKQAGQVGYHLVQRRDPARLE